MYNRKKIYSIEETFNLLGDRIFITYPRRKYDKFDDEEIRINSQRYQLFKAKGTTCVTCGLKGTYFALEKAGKTERYHLNLYGIDKNGKEIMITKDHIIPKSKGGLDKLENYQVMCECCNSRKGNDYEFK